MCYKPVDKDFEVVMTMGLLPQPMPLIHASEIVAQAIMYDYYPGKWEGHLVFYGVFDPFRKRVTFYSMDDDQVWIYFQSYDLGEEQDFIVWATNKNRPLYDV